MFILSEISTQCSVHGSAVIRPNSEISCIALLVGNRNIIDLYNIQINNLEFIQSITLENKILTFTTVCIDGKDVIIFIDDIFQIGLIVISSDLKVTIKIITKFSTKGQVQAFEYPPKIVPQKQENPQFIVFYVFHSTLQVLHLKDHLQVDDIIPKKKSKKRRRETRDPWWSIDTISTGRIIIKQIISLGYDDKALAILYKDISSTFYVRYLQINNAGKPATMLAQFPEFQEEPCLVIPMSIGGHITLTKSALFYFPTKVIRNLTISKGMRDISTSSINGQPYVVKSLVIPNGNIEDQNYISYEIIDENRILLVSESGNSSMLYIDLKKSSTNTIIVNQVSMISLGDVTIPNFNGLHHITGDLFFQSSRLSRSVIFLVLPNQPHIHIRAFIEGSPPVLDIALGSKEIYTCQGGWLGSEIRKYNSALNSIKVLESVNIGFKPNKAKMVKDTMVVRNNSEDYLVFGISDLKPCKDEKKLSDKLLLMLQNNFDHAIAKYIPDLDSMVICDNSSKIKVVADEFTVEFESDEKFVPSSIDGVEISENERLILISSWSNSFEIWIQKYESVELVYRGEIEENQNIIDSLITYDTSSKTISVILLTLECWKQVNFIKQADNRLKEINSHSHNIYGCPYSIQKYNDTVVLCNDKYLVPLKRDILLDFYSPSYYPSTGIIHVAMMKRDVMIIVYSSGLIDKVKIEQQPQTRANTQQSLFSKKLFIESLFIKHTDYLVAVLNIRLIEQEEEVVTSELHLVDSTTFEVIDVYKMVEGEQILDICEVDAGLVEGDALNNTFLCLTSTHVTPIHFLGIENGKIIKHQATGFSGLDLSEEIKLQSLSVFDYSAGTFLCSGNISFLMTLNDDIEWIVIPESVKYCSTFTIDQAVLFNEIYLVDAIDGLFLASVNNETLENNQMRFTKVDIDGYAQTQMTSIATISKSNFTYIITGDAHGNVVVIKTNVINPLDKNITKFNIGDQINVIVELGIKNSLTTKICAIGTLLGGLYVLNETNQADDKLEECWSELKSYSKKNYLSSLDFVEQSRNNLIETESTECDEIINGKSVSNVLSELVVDPKTISSSYSSLSANKHILQQLYIETNT